jgi:alpha-galactosidase
LDGTEIVEVTSDAEGCAILLTGTGQLSVRNRYFERTWRIGTDGRLTAESFRDTTAEVEWLASPSAQAAPTPATALPDEPRTVTLKPISAPSVIEAVSLTAELVAMGEKATLRYRLQVFPDCRGVRVQLTIEGNAETTATSDSSTTDAEPTGIESDAAPTTAAQSNDADILDSLTLAPQHLRLTQVTFQDQTDHRNELVFEQEWLLHVSERTLKLSGSVFHVEDVLTGNGLIFVKEAPLPYARPVPNPYDLEVRAKERRFTFTGQGADDSGAGYAFITLAYSGGAAGRIAAFQQYQRCLRPYEPGRDGILLSNTWGDRNRDARITADFMAQEIEAGARLGVDVIQIDDGWEVGATSNSVRAKEVGGVWEGYYAKTDNFWSVNPERFPNGLEPLIAAAKEKGMRFGLWCSPDSSGDFANWQRDADTILRLHHELGTQYIKIDGVKVRSKTGERNLDAFFHRVQTESAGRVVFDLDVTAEVRPGYFGMMNVGPLFVENRYTDWHRYWPHFTLRNLWKLAHYVDPLRLRLEWLNHERNTEQYENDPFAPIVYRPDYLFATVMLSSPLGWFEVSNLPETYFTDAAPLIATWKQHRDAIFSGNILPIGSAPDGVSWTGFVSVAQDGKSAYLLMFREASARIDWSGPVPSLLANFTEPVVQFERLGGDGTADLYTDSLLVQIPDANRFFFGRITL